VAAVEAGVPAERRAEAAARVEEYAAHLAALRKAVEEPPPTSERLIVELAELRQSLVSV
jgi:hypothetical protein